MCNLVAQFKEAEAPNEVQVVAYRNGRAMRFTLGADITLALPADTFKEMAGSILREVLWAFQTAELKNEISSPIVTELDGWE